MTTFNKDELDLMAQIENDLKNKFVLVLVNKDYIRSSKGGATAVMLNEMTLTQAYMLNKYFMNFKNDKEWDKKQLSLLELNQELTKLKE